MLLRLLCTTLLAGLMLFGCGGATPQPESAESEANRADQAGSENEGIEDDDPETTEEVIETSEPLD